MLSGSGDDTDIERAYRIGIDAYLVKPAGIHGLPDVVRRLGLPHLLLPRRA
jgi:DNA-binding NarL/FixJ family response regulator